MDYGVAPASPQSQRTSSTARDSGDATTKNHAGAKRSSYVSRACQACQKRKVKCSGEQPGPCQSCHVNSLDCVYNQGPRKRRAKNKGVLRTSKSYVSTNAPLGTREAMVTHSSSADRPPLLPEPAAIQAPPAVSVVREGPREDLMARVLKLEQALGLGKLCDRTSSMIATDGVFPLQLERAKLMTALDPEAVLDDDTVAVSLRPTRTDPPACSDEEPQHGSNSVHNTTTTSAPSSSISTFATTRCTFTDRDGIPSCCLPDLYLFSNESSTDNTTSVRAVLGRYFAYNNPHYPCLNENQVFAQIEEYSSMQDMTDPSTDTVQFIALIHLVCALMAILEENCCKSEQPTPGSARVQQATHLLTHVTWLADGNLLTVQCLIIKATYLLYAENFNAAYEASGQAVRLCYLNGLHNQSMNGEHSPFEEQMRQRVFWSLYCLERNISMICGVPYAVRDSEIRVSFPAPLDDHLLGATEQLPEENPQSSCIPYLCSTVKWASLSSEIWDRLFCANAKRPADEDFIVSMDARIQNFSRSQFEILKWAKKDYVGLDGPDAQVHYESFARILHLRINHLRLQLRREGLLSPTFRVLDLPICMSIATDSVDTIHRFYTSSSGVKSLQRYSCIVYLTGAVIALTGVLLGPEQVDPEIFTQASRAFHQALQVMRHIAPNLALARHTLKRLEHIITPVERLISNLSNETTTTEVVSLGNDNPLPTGPCDDILNLENHAPLALDLMAQTSFDFSPLEDGLIRMAFTPAFNTHYWDPQPPGF